MGVAVLDGGPSESCEEGYLFGAYRMATAPELSGIWSTSVKLAGFDSPANSVGPWPASLGWTMNSYSSIKPSSVNASASFSPPTNNPLPGSCGPQAGLTFLCLTPGSEKCVGC